MATSKSRENGFLNNLWDPATKTDLHKWVTKSLEPICDADPPVLADYVLALLQHEGNEAQVRKRLASQLEEFLLDHTQSFVDTLLSALRTKAYIPYTSAGPGMPSSASTIITPPSDAIPIPLDAFVPSSSPQSRGLKRGPDDHNAYLEEGHPTKAPRGHNQDSVSRTPSNPTIVGETQRVNQPSSPNIQATSEVVQANGASPAESTKPICRDYHYKGYCSRGALCNYSHGADAVVPPPGMWLTDGTGFNPMMSFMPMMMPFGSIPLPYDGGAYDPNQSRMDLNNSGAVAPRQTSKTPVPDTPPPIAIQNGLESSGVVDESSQLSARDGHRLSHPGVRGRGRGRQVPSNRPSSNERTLVVEKIPPENLTVDIVNQWFKKFGSVTNVAIDKRGSKALVSFNNHSEALVAWKSQDAVFGNRFVKVYWHRPVEGQGVAGKLALEASAPRFQKIENNSTRSEDQEVATEKSGHSRNASTLGIEARKALEKNMAEQKVLFSRLKTAEEDKKSAILARIRVLSDGMNDPLSVPPSNLLLDEIRPPSSTPLLRSNSEQLDKELDLRQAVQDLTRRAQDPKEDHDAIRVELEELKAKAISEGIDVEEGRTRGGPVGYAPTHYVRRPSRGHPRGRFGGRAMYRGRGGGLKLDNRPKQLIVRGVPIEDDRQLDQVREWHQETGQADTMTFEENGDIKVRFRTRAAAEQALAASSQLAAHIKAVQVSWPTLLNGANGSVPTAEKSGSVQQEPTSDSMDAEPDMAGWGQGGDE